MTATHGSFRDTDAAYEAGLVDGRTQGTARERALRLADEYIERTVTRNTGTTVGSLYSAKGPEVRLALVLDTARFLLGQEP